MAATSTESKKVKSKAKTKQKKNLVIVESPAKAKTLKKFLGSNYKIEASMGHVRDLPKSEMAISPDNDFEPKYITIRGKGDLLAKLRKEAADASKVYLATDPDREGEAISWHLAHALKMDPSKAERITFNEITKTAVKNSIKEARPIDMDLVDAQQARRVLDRLVGYKISPLLWKKVKKGLSAGRVQSVTLKIICDREQEIENFLPEEYWTIDAELITAKGKKLLTKYYGKGGKKVELKSEDEVKKIMSEIEDGSFAVAEVKHGTRVRRPVPPFTTSTLQQEASKKLGFAASKTMLIAQQLYEGIDLPERGTMGLVSYIRTDSTRISDEAFAEAYEYLSEKYGKDYVEATKPEYKVRRGAQDAHEAIRPTSVLLTPAEVKEHLSRDQYRLYNLIWLRFTASNMTPAVFDTVSSRIVCNEHIFRASGSVLKFEGFMKVYSEDEDEKPEGMIPEINEGEVLTAKEIKPAQHFTQPPPRYSEAMLVKALEENGVGRPSTYAPTISTIVNRGYVTKENKVFYPTELGEIVNEIMENNFGEIVDVEFTAKMEQDLDHIEDGEIPWKDVIREFYYPFDEEVKAAEERIGEIEIKDEETDIICENCGRNMVIKLGRYGKFLACPGFPECRNTKPFFEDAGVNCPLCGGKVLVKKSKKGRKYFGCENSPECGFMSWNKPTGEKCPRCGEPLVIKGTQKPKICCSSSDCGYFTELPAEEKESDE